METIRKKMEGLKSRLEQSDNEAKDAENELAETNRRADKVRISLKIDINVNFFATVFVNNA